MSLFARCLSLASCHCRAFCLLWLSFVSLLRLYTISIYTHSHIWHKTEIFSSYVNNNQQLYSIEIHTVYSFTCALLAAFLDCFTVFPFSHMHTAHGTVIRFSFFRILTLIPLAKEFFFVAVLLSLTLNGKQSNEEREKKEPTKNQKQTKSNGTSIHPFSQSGHVNFYLSLNLCSFFCYHVIFVFCSQVFVVTTCECVCVCASVCVYTHNCIPIWLCPFSSLIYAFSHLFLRLNLSNRNTQKKL